MRPRGVSLVELIFTATLLSLVFLVLLSLLPSSLMSVRQGEHRLHANALAQAILDECASGPFADLEVDRTYLPTSPGPLGQMLQRQQLRLDDGTVFEPTLEVSGVPGIARTSLARVRITLTWKEKTSRPVVVRELEISSILR